MLKKFLLLCVMLLTVLSASAGFAAGKYSPAIAAARAEMPAAVEMNGLDEHDGIIVLDFSDPKTLLYYEVKVASATNKVMEINVKGSNLPGSTIIEKTPEELREKVLAEYPDAKDISFRIKSEGNLEYYEATFTTTKFNANVEINPLTGAFCKRELKYF